MKFRIDWTEVVALHLLQCFITKLGVFFKSLQMTVIISSTMSVMTHSQEHDTQLVAARGERERERRFIRFPCKCGSSAFVLNCITLDKCWTAASLYCLIGCCFHGGSSVAELVSCNSIPSFLVSQPLQLLTTLMGSTLVPLSVVLIGAIWYWFPHWFLICFLCKKKTKTVRQHSYLSSTHSFITSESEHSGATQGGQKACKWLRCVKTQRHHKD